MARAATNSTASRWGHTWTLSTGVDFTSWIEPDLTTVSRRWVWPAGAGGGRGRAGGGHGAVAGPGGGDGARRRRSASAAPAALRALAALERSSRWAGILLSPAAAAGAAVGRRRRPRARRRRRPRPAAALPSARASSARLRRCSGISVMASLRSI